MQLPRMLGLILVLTSLFHSSPAVFAQSGAGSVLIPLGTADAIEATTAHHVRFGSGTYPSKHTIQINPTSDPATCTAIVEFSLDNSAWFGATDNQTCTISEVLSETDFATHANWASADDFDDTGGNCAYTHSAGSGTCTQASGGFASTATGSDTYTFTYTVSGVSGDVACTITTGFAAEATSLTVTAGVQSTTFTSKPTPGDFVISCTSSSGGATFDDVSLKSNEGVYVTIIDEQAAYVRGSVTALTGRSVGSVKTAVETLDETDFATHASWAPGDGWDDSGGNAVFTVPEVLDETGFATHAEWDVTSGFDDSGGDAVFAVPETLTETAFTTHANWDTTDDFDDTGGNCAYTHSAGAGTCLQEDGDFAVVGVGAVQYTFAYTIASTTGDPACSITSAFADGGAALTISDGAQTTTFTSAATPTDFIISCTSSSGGFTIDDVSLKQVAFTATLTQETGSWLVAGVVNSVYTFGYTISSTTGTPACTITTSFADAATALTVSDGAQTTDVTSDASSVSHFVISCTSAAATDTTTFDDVTLKNNTHSASLTQADSNYANAMVASELYTLVYDVASTTGTLVCQITSGCSEALDLNESDGNAQVTECTSSATITDDFVLTCTASDIADTITFDDISWYQQNAANEDPIHIITAADHGLSDGDKVTITGVTGNTNANVSGQVVTVVDADEFTLDSVVGNAPWLSGGTITSSPEIEFIYLGGR